MTWKQPLSVGLISEYNSFKQKDLWRKKAYLHIQISHKVCPISLHVPQWEQDIFSWHYHRQEKTEYALLKVFNHHWTKEGMKEESWDTWHGGWNSHPEPQRLPQSSNQQIFLEWEASEGRATVTDRVYVWPGWLTLINRILNELYNDLMFFIGVLINSARSSQCHPLVPGSEQLQLTCLICHWTSYILVLSAPSWLYTFF